MTLEEATIICAKFQYLVGTKFNNDNISSLIVVPNDVNSIHDAAIKAAHRIVNDDLPLEFSDYLVIALLNMDKYPNPNFRWINFEIILNDLR